MCPKDWEKLIVSFLFLEEQDGEAEEDPDHIFSGDAVLFAINEVTNTTTPWLTCSKTECSFSKRQVTDNFFTHARKVFHIYGKGRLTINDPIRYGDEVALFYRVNDEGDGLWLGCGSRNKRCGLGTCPGLPHLNHWMWRAKHSCDENKFVITGRTDLQNVTTSRQPVRIEEEITISKLNYPSMASGKRQMGQNSTLLLETPFLDNFGHWVINKGTKINMNHSLVRSRACSKSVCYCYLRMNELFVKTFERCENRIGADWSRNKLHSKLLYFSVSDACIRRLHLLTYRYDRQVWK